MISWHEKMMLSVKPEVHNVSQRRQRRTEPWLLATCTKIWEFGCAVSSYASGQTDRETERQTNKQTNRHITILCTPFTEAK